MEVKRILQKNKLSKVSSTKSGTLMMLISQVLSIKKRPRSEKAGYDRKMVELGRERQLGSEK
jgi:hypothetical protein